MSDNELHAQLEKLQEILGKKITLDPARNKTTVEPEASVRKDYASAWQEQHLTCEKASGDTVPSRLIEDEFSYQGFDDSALCIGEPLEEDVAFCPFQRIKHYPEQFIGKRNKPLVCTWQEKSCSFLALTMSRLNRSSTASTREKHGDCTFSRRALISEDG